MRGERHTQVIVILILLIDSFGPAFSIPMDSVNGFLLIFIVVVHTGKVVKVPFQGAVLEERGALVSIRDE